ncbi:hypothetical protein [Bacillus sp. EB600]|uniref:hypothetical protein n=1 Tax=Bacillus sp. EB600 TaxID=2806345 RepID=UPI002108EDA3|nr:hypothetical protein [Bacillus sp. EB600]MCQ6279661.1 hypothetical protein [Bacillus sp. EB600]
MKLINAEVKDVNPKNSTFNILLTFSNDVQALLNCRAEGEVKAYNLSIMGGTCPCCYKPNCASFFAKRHEYLIEAQKFTDFPSELVAPRELVNR